MKERPILFQTDMVRAILDGRKKQTRRVIRPNKFFKSTGRVFEEADDLHAGACKCPYGKVGDLLWVRETHYRYGKWIKNGVSKTGRQKWKFKPLREVCREIKYFDNPPRMVHKNKYRKEGWYKRPSIFMPKWAARLWLKITEVRVERVQEISWLDAIAEGIVQDMIPACGDHPNLECYVTVPDDNHAYKTPLEAFKPLWDSINAKRGYGWDKNPWVWVITFERYNYGKN